MKQTIKYLILALLIPAAYCFTACDTDIEPIDQQIIKPDQQDQAQYAAYLAALKAYKASEHYIVYASKPGKCPRRTGFGKGISALTARFTRHRGT